MYLRKSDGGDIMAKWIDTLLDLKEEVEVMYNCTNRQFDYNFNLDCE